MKNEKLLDAIGEVRDEYIQDAEVMPAKRPGWVRWGAIAACCCLLVGSVTLGQQFLSQPERDSGTPDAGGAVSMMPKPELPALESKEDSGVDVIPMVYVNDTLFVQSYDGITYSEKKAEFAYLGKIESNVLEYDGNDGTPKENFTTNQSLVDFEVYQYQDNVVLYREDISMGYLLFVPYGGEDTEAWNQVLYGEQITGESSQPAVTEDVPVQGDAEIDHVNPLEEVWGGRYLDENGHLFVWLTENTAENQKKVFEENPALRKENVTFQTADYSLAYLNELLNAISKSMENGVFSSVSSACVMEQVNRIEVTLTEGDSEAEKAVLSLDTIGGAIQFRYAAADGTEDIALLE